MKCKKCGADFGGKFCPYCGNPAKHPVKRNLIPFSKHSLKNDKIKNGGVLGENNSSNTEKIFKPNKPQKPIYKKWWFYFIAVIIILIIAIISGIVGENKPVEIVWSEMVLGDFLPEPPAQKGKIIENSFDGLRIELNDITDKQYADYVNACKEKGFTIDTELDSSSFNAYNADGYKLSLSHYDSKGELNINLEKPIEMSEIVWPTSEAGKKLPEPKSQIGNFSYEYEDNFYVYIGNINKTDYNDYVKACSDKGFTVDYIKEKNYYYAHNNEGWCVSLKYEGNNIMSIYITAPDDETTISESSTFTTAETTIVTTTAATAQNTTAISSTTKKTEKDTTEKKTIRQNKTTTKPTTKMTTKETIVHTTSRSQRIVYGSKTGNHYHTIFCRYANGDKMTIAEAESRGWEPCAVCNP